MTQKSKRKAEQQSDETTKTKKAKKVKHGEKQVGEAEKSVKQTFKKDSKNTDKLEKKNIKNKIQKPMKKSFNKIPGQQSSTEKPDWNEYKKKQKLLQVKRKEGRNSYDVTVELKKLGEKLIKKKLKNQKADRDEICKELHKKLKKDGNYVKLVMTHDIARIIQQLLKYCSQEIRKEISKDLNSVIVNMLKSKYAKRCVKNLLKYGDDEIRSQVIKQFYGEAVRLSSHSVAAPVFDYAYTTHATPLQRQHLVQEFFGDIYKKAKDDSVKHLKDVYKLSPDMKLAALGATKANIQLLLNKEYLHLHICQTVLMEFMEECSEQDRTELIGPLTSHIVVLANSKEGIRVALTIIWQGTTKDRKLCAKTIKEHILDMCKHEYGHLALITLFDTSDDTVLMNKILLSEILQHSLELATNEWGRKILLWLVAPADSVHFHPKFINELEEGRKRSTCKKESEKRRKEILLYVQSSLLKQITDDPSKWFASNSIAIVAAAILKAGTGDDLKLTFDAVAKLITDKEWQIKGKEDEILCGIEDAGLHMLFKKMIQHDKINKESDLAEFGAAIVEHLTDQVIKKCIKLNRGCFLLVFIIESNSDNIQNKMKDLLKSHINLINKQKTFGSKILLQKIQ